jgi:glycosyltransferase involved in cell wall biosynthesis
MVSGQLNQHSIVYFGNDWRAENRTSSHHIAARLAQRAPLLYVSTPGARAPQASGRDVARIFKKLTEAAKLPEQVGDQMWVMTMPQIPFRSLPLIPQLNHAAGRALLARAIKHLGFKNVISWFVVPHPGYFARRLGESLSVYYCIDDYAAFPGVDKAAIQHYDGLLTRNSDLVFFASKRLWTERQGVRPDAIYSPHGVDFDLFHQAVDDKLPVADATRGLKKPVIGWFGLIGAWVDVALIAEMARARPNWTFLLIGLTTVDVTALKALPNVVWAGVQPYRSLPQWAKAFDVCIAPYILNQQLLNSNPLKIREYLATGRPVVTAWAPEIGNYDHVAQVVRDRGDFLPAIDAALAEGPLPGLEARLAAVRDSTWDARVDIIVQELEHCLAAKQHAI